MEKQIFRVGYDDISRIYGEHKPIVEEKKPLRTKKNTVSTKGIDWNTLYTQAQENALATLERTVGLTGTVNTTSLNW